MPIGTIIYPLLHMIGVRGSLLDLEYVFGSSSRYVADLVLVLIRVLSRSDES